MFYDLHLPWANVILKNASRFTIWIRVLSQIFWRRFLPAHRARYDLIYFLNTIFYLVCYRVSLKQNCLARDLDLFETSLILKTLSIDELDLLRKSYFMRAFGALRVLCNYRARELLRKVGL